MNYRVSLTLASTNVKTGPLPVSTTSKECCPPSCPFYAKGCYASAGPIAIHWRAVTSGLRGMLWKAFCQAVAAFPMGTLWRHNQAGDLCGNGEVIDAKALRLLIRANRGKRGFTYTHKHGTAANVRLIREANQNGFTVNLSANGLAHADKLAGLNAGPVVTVLPHAQTENCKTPGGRKVVVCPATQREGVSCWTCGLCAKPDRTFMIGFPAHGATWKSTEAALVA